MKNIFVIAKNTFRAAIRDRILHGILVFAAMFIVFTVFLGSISLGEDIVVIRNLGLAGIYLFGLVITIFLGASLIYTEIERRTIYLILSKPVSASEMILGKFFGLLASIALTIILMAFLYAGVVAYQGGGFDALGMMAVLVQLLEVAIFVALVMVFSMLATSTPFAATIYAILMLYIGHSLGLLVKFAEKRGLATRMLANIAYYVFPNLEKFNIRNLVVHDVGITLNVLFFTVLYAACYTAILLWAATLLLKRKDL